MIKPLDNACRSILALPDDTFFGAGESPGILGRLSPAELARLGEVNHEFLRLSRSDAPWRKYLLALTPLPAATSTGPRQVYPAYLAARLEAAQREARAARENQDVVTRNAIDFQDPFNPGFDQISAWRCSEITRLEARTRSAETRRDHLSEALTVALARVAEERLAG